MDAAVRPPTFDEHVYNRLPEAWTWRSRKRPGSRFPVERCHAPPTKAPGSDSAKPPSGKTPPSEKTPPSMSDPVEPEDSKKTAPGPGPTTQYAITQDTPTQDTPTQDTPTQ